MPHQSRFLTHLVIHTQTCLAIGQLGVIGGNSNASGKAQKQKKSTLSRPQSYNAYHLRIEEDG